MAVTHDNSQIGTPERPPAASPRPPRRWTAVWIIGLVLLALAVDAVLIEPYRIEVTHSEVHGAVGQPLKIAQLTDLHTHGLGRRERHMLSILAAEHPDVIVITGDTAGFGGNYEDCAEVYKQLHAPLGVWFVRGNWETDYQIRPLRRERQFYESTGVHLLLNANVQLRPGVWLVGFDDPTTGTPRPDLALAGIPADGYKIALFHAPAYFNRIASRVNLALAGHTHGGQVHIPLVRPFWLPEGSGRYLAGWYDIGGSKMYVNRGLGMSILPIRFLVRPEVAIITVES